MARKPDEGFCAYGAGIIARHLNALRQEIEGVRRSDDIENVHRMRVASRRLRSALPQFLECYSAKDSRRWLRQIRDITRALGAARDTDVQLAALEKFLEANSDPDHRPGLRRLMLRLAQRRVDQQVGVAAGLDQLESSGALEKLDKRLAPLLAQRDKVYLFTPYLYRRGYEATNLHLNELLSYDPYVSQPECMEELHAMRIAAKRLRYTMELYASIYPGELKPQLQVVRKVQEMLGDLHDCDVWAESLPRFLNEEEALTRKFFGHTRSFKRVAPGILAFAAERAAQRLQVYAEFVPYWQSIMLDGTWSGLLDAIQIPFHQAAPEKDEPSGQAEQEKDAPNPA